MNWNSIDVEICSFIGAIRGDLIINNEVIRDDIFSILESKSIVIYYPLKDEDNRGFHVKRIVHDKLADFVYINTSMPLEEQIFTAAHELGHICDVASYVWQNIGEKVPMSLKQEEDITDRFAADLLMPGESFKKLFEAHMRELGITDNIVSMEQLVRLMAFLVTDFLCPYEAVRRRLLELNIISEEVGDILQGNETARKLVNILTADQNTYRREKTMIKSISGLRSKIESAETQGVDEFLVNRLKDAFGLKDVVIDSTQIVLHNLSGEKTDNG